MFDRAKKVLDNIIRLDINQIINEILADKEIQRFIIDLNTQGQLFEKGINALNVSLSDIGGDYSPVTIELSKAKGRPKKSPSLIDLFDDGIFYKSFKITLFPKSFIMSADPNRGDSNLFDDWGEDVVGLTEESKQIVRDALRKKVQPIIRRKAVA